MQPPSDFWWALESFPLVTSSAAALHLFPNETNKQAMRSEAVERNGPVIIFARGRGCFICQRDHSSLSQEVLYFCLSRDDDFEGCRFSMVSIRIQ